MKKGFNWFIIIIAVIILIGAIILFSGSSSNKNASGGMAIIYNIAIKGFAFSPTPVTVKAGDTVVWTNQDSMAHTVTSDTGTELQSGQIPTGQTYSHKFMTPGTYYYHCSIHVYMKGTIVVQ